MTKIHLNYIVRAAILIAVLISAVAAQQPFSLLLKGPQGTVKLGSEISVEITLTNNTRHELRMWKSPGEPAPAELQYVIKARDARGHPLSATEYGRMLRDERFIKERK